MVQIKLLLALLARLTAIGLPPGLENERALRAWLLQVVELLQWVAALATVTETDDKVLEVLSLALENDEQWAIVYGLVVRTDLAPPEVTMAAGDDQVMSLAGQAAVDPLTILAIISAVVDLLREWRKRRDG